MRIPPLVAAALMLAAAGCRQDAPAEAGAVAAPPAAASPVATSDAPAQAAAARPAATAAMGEAAAADDHTSVNAAIDAVLGDHAKYEQAIVAFQSAVAGKDRAAVAALVDYPFTAHIDGGTMKIADAAAFVARYEDIVTPEIADVIAGQAYADLFVNYKGVMFGNGEAWINGICKDTACQDVDVRVVAIQPAR